MEGFDLHVHGLAITFQENLYRKSYSLESVVKLPIVDDLMRELRCANCNNLALPTLTRCQKDAEDFHLICDSCATKSSTGCPVIAEDQAAACGNKLVGFEKGLPRHIHQILQQWQLPRGCRAKQYGCTFIGTATELQQHEMFHCTFRKLRVCYQPSKTGTGAHCGEIFNTYQQLNLHLLITHGFTYQYNQTSVQHLQFKDACELADEWVVIERRLLDYPQQRFCLLTMTQNKTHIQMWLREIDPHVDSATLPFYIVSTPVGPSVSETIHRCRTRILPHHLEDLENVGDNVFEVNKKFLRRIADDRKDGNIHFSVTFKFLDACLSETAKTEVNLISGIDFINFPINGAPPDAGRDCRHQPASNLLETEGSQHTDQKRSSNGGHYRGGTRKYNGGRNTQDATKGSSAAATKEPWRGNPRGSSTTHAERTPWPKQTKKFTRTGTAQSEEHATRSDAVADTKSEAQAGASSSSNSKDTSNNGQTSSGHPKTRQGERKPSGISQAYRDRWKIPNRSENDDMAP